MVNAVGGDVFSDKRELIGECKNKVDDAKCFFWKKHGACHYFPKRMFLYCKRTCHFCSGICEDVLSVKCRWLASYGACYTHRRRMEKLCPKSCEFCRQRDWTSPARRAPTCSSSQYGCCWDRKTAAKGPHQQGCPECKDDREDLCRRFKADCYVGSRNRGFMERDCPASCGRCVLK